jgi:hypothetical protein
MRRPGAGEATGGQRAGVLSFPTMIDGYFD